MELMFFKFVLLFFLIFGFNTVISAKNSWVEGIEKWTAVGVKAHINKHEKSIASVMIAIETLGKAIPFGTAVANIISSI